MRSEDDPEARIRELEQPLANTARASEAAEGQLSSKWAAPSGPAFPTPPLPLSGSLPGPSLRTFSRGRAWWIVAGVVVIGMIAVPAAFMLLTAHRVSRSGLTTLVPIPSLSTASPAPSGGITTTPATEPPIPPASENLIVTGISENRTVACNHNTVNISGVSNTVVITGHCMHLSVSGVQNKVTVEAVDSIEASGFSNQVTYRNGSPQVDQSGQGNDIHQG